MWPLSSCARCSACPQMWTNAFGHHHLTQHVPTTHQPAMGHHRYTVVSSTGLESCDAQCAAMPSCVGYELETVTLDCELHTSEVGTFHHTIRALQFATHSPTPTQTLLADVYRAHQLIHFIRRHALCRITDSFRISVCALCSFACVCSLCPKTPHLTPTILAESKNSTTLTPPHVRAVQCSCRSITPSTSRPRATKKDASHANE
jgi:hypothetical protein